MKPNWKLYEEETYKVIKQLNPTSAVYHDVEITGKFSKTSRQVDVQLVDPNQYDFIAYECKDYKAPVDIPRVESFAGKLRDLGTPKGAMVSNSGYTKPAMRLASEWNVDLLSLVNTENPLIRSQLFLHGMFHGTHLKSFSASMATSASVDFLMSQEISMIKLMNEDGRVVPAYDLFAHFWNSDSTPLSRAPGNYEYIYEKPCIVRLVDLKNQVVPLDRFAFEYQVVRDSFIGQIKIINTSGLYNVIKQTYTTKSFATEKLIPTKIIEQWKHVENSENVTDKPQFVLEAIAEMPASYPFDN